MAKRLKRRGATTTFSVSVDRDTRRLLRRVADHSYGGNVSELITQIARQAARQEAARALLEAHGRAPFTDEEAQAFEHEIARELSRPRPRTRSGRSAA